VASSLNADVLVIGGGPAGTSAAITCARAGRSVILVEAKRFPRHVPGETLHPGVEPLLKCLGAADGLEQANFLRHPGVWVERAGKPEFQAYGADESGLWLGYQAMRSEFDAVLLHQARNCGVRILQPHRAVSVLRDRDRVAGAETTAGSVQAAFTVDASGNSTWLARQLLLKHRKASPKLIALYGYMEGECPIRDAAPCFTYLPDGWVWTARVRPNLYHWTRLFTTTASLRRASSPAEFDGLKPVSPVKGSDVTWRILEGCAGAGYFVAGDAASVSDPSSSHGVLRALMSGMLAGHLVLCKTFCNKPEPTLSAEYDESLRAWFEADLAHGSKLSFFHQVR
jgi:flavin-dependent dehydrogenase